MNMNQPKLKQLDLFASDWPMVYYCDDVSVCCQGCHREGLGIVYNKDFFFCCQSHPEHRGHDLTKAVLHKIVRKDNGRRVFR